MTITLDKLLTTAEVAEALKVAPSTVLSAIHTGRLKASKIGKGYRIRSEDAEIFVNRLVSR